MIVLKALVGSILIIPLINAILEDDILYDIQWQPTVDTPIDLDNSFQFISKRKEKYSCTFPTTQTTVTTSPDTISISDLEPFLTHLHSKKPCLYRIDPYWSYELCHGTHIRQYHELIAGNSRKVVQEYFLGYYHNDRQDFMTNADNQSAYKIHYKTINHQQIPMLSLRYTDGTNCDINSDRPRETLVFYVCNDNGNDGIVSFQEVSTCYYEMIVASSRLCSIPAFSPVETNQHTIDCYARENALQKPRNLNKLEQERKLLSKIGGSGAQFTMTSADGTTFIISYEYIDEDDLPTMPKTPSTTPPSVESAPVTTTEDDREFLRGFLSGTNCLTGGSGWWRYELCHGKHVIQFHDDTDQRVSIFLGKWNQEKHVEWITNNPKKKSTSNIKERQYIPLFYGDGDQCELTKTPRTVEVKLKCSKRTNQSRSPTMYLVEPEPCAYVLGVESPIFCNIQDQTDEYGIPNPEQLLKD